MATKLTPAEEAKVEYIPFKGPGFKTFVPSDWLIQATPQHQAIFLSPPRKDKASASLIIDLQFVPDDMDLVKIRSMLQQTRKEVVPKAEVITEEETLLDRRKAYHCLYRYTHPESKEDIIQRLISVLVDGMLVSLTATRSAGKIPDIDEALATMIDQFRFR